MAGATAEELRAAGRARQEGRLQAQLSSFPEIEAFLRGEDPVAARADLIALWETLPSSAGRREPQK